MVQEKAGAGVVRMHRVVQEGNWGRRDGLSPPGDWVRVVEIQGGIQGRTPDPDSRGQ